MTKLTSSQILAELQMSSHQRVQVAITDIDGILRGKYMHKEKFLSAAEKDFGFCNVVFGWDSADLCYSKCDYTGWHTGYPDANATIDLGTFRRTPWDGGVPMFLADFALDICPRNLLKKIIAKADALGFKPYCGLEFEWFNFRETPQSLAAKSYVNPEPLTPGMFGYSLLRSNLNHDFFTAIMDQMEAWGVPIEGLHTETGPGVYEAAIQVTDALEAADRAVLFKTGVKQIGYKHGVLPTFMAKWNAKLPGCSGHIHQSLWDKNNEKNLFYDEKSKEKMSPLFKHYLAGQLACMDEILPMFAPTVNSYKRLVEGYWAPTKVTWGLENRTTALRVIPGSSKSTRLETRVSGSDINPYLGVAAAIASGLYGIEKKLELKDAPVKGSGYEAKDARRLPKTLVEAAQKMGQSKIAKELFGETFVNHYVNTRLWEASQYDLAVTNWELERYFELI